MGKGSKRFPDPRDLPHAFKVLCPDELISSVMGRGGATKDSIQEDTGARLLVSQRDEYYPGTRLRILTVFADSPDGVFNALTRVVERLVDCGTRERSGEWQSATGELTFLAKDSQEFVFRCAVSRVMGGAIIGAGGRKVKEIRQDAKAQVRIDPDVKQDHQECTVTAREDGIVTALKHINAIVQEKSKDDSKRGDFWDWVHTTFPRDGGAEQSSGGWSSSNTTPIRDRERSPRRENSRRENHSEWPEEEPQGNDEPGSVNDALWMIDQACRDFPQGALDMEYTINCEMPKNRVSFMIGKNGSHVQDVRKTTRTNIHFAEADAEAETQTLVIQGKLVNTYRAHVLMMKRYHDGEAGAKDRPEAAEGMDADMVAALKRQVEALQQALEVVAGGGAAGGTSSTSKGSGKGKSKSKGR